MIILGIILTCLFVIFVIIPLFFLHICKEKVTWGSYKKIISLLMDIE